MSTITRAIQTVRPHIPLIRFRNNQGTTENVIKAATAQQQILSQPAQNLPNIGTIPHGSALLEDFELPAKYRRKTISEEEIAYIERGGPE